jgi:hypothetical protein
MGWKKRKQGQKRKQREGAVDLTAGMVRGAGPSFAPGSSNSSNQNQG